MQRAASVPILLYHEIQPDGWVDVGGNPLRRPYVLPVSEFQRQMDYLAAHGYLGICVERFFHLRELDPEALARTAVLVFDDGYEGQYRYALPILKEAGFSATFFIIASSIGKEGYMSWVDLNNLIAHGMEVGSHTMTHPYPSELTEAELFAELADSKAVLEIGLNQRINALSSPTGFFDARMPRFALEAGYRSLCISRVGLNGPSTDPFAFKKIGIKFGQRFETFARVVCRCSATLGSLRTAEEIRDLLKKLLRRRNYERLKAILLQPRPNTRARIH